VLNVLLSVAQWERETISERTSDALQFKIRKHERCGKVRFGYDLAPDGVTLIPNASEQDTIRVMKDLRATGRSYRDIAAELNTRGIPTKEGKPWVHTSVKGILMRAAA
jgi:DNA invertase Pin-like site-specific DNA recombinase